jgi:selenocysteine lyase/cysteine desulfurase
MLPLDPARIRAAFPAFSEPSLEGHAFFENAGGSYTSRHVLDRLETYYRRTKVQPYGVYPASREAGEAMDRAFARMAEALNVGTDWIQFGPLGLRAHLCAGAGLWRLAKAG